jgi:hypothetical protein
MIFDQYNLHDNITTIYRNRLFSSAIRPQPASRLLSLPAEIRLIIYDYVFAPPFDHSSAKFLAPLATCRLINREALKLAFERCQFRISTHANLMYRPRLWELGDLQKHLRHVEISMPMSKLNAVGPNNPFILTQLPLNMLKISFSEDVQYYCSLTWEREISLYNTLISAILYRSSTQKLGDKTQETYRNPYLQMKRRLELKTWNFRPLPLDLWNVMLHCQTKDVVVEVKKGYRDPDFLWNAFVHFQLVDRPYKKIKMSLPDAADNAGVATAWWKKHMFYDEGEASFVRLVTAPVPM